MKKQPITQMHQIEITSRCNLRCKYCTHPNLQRPKMDMDDDTFRLALYWAREFVLRGWQRSLNMCGIGESTIHPEFVRYMHLAREAVGWDCDIVLATNGVAVTEDMVKAIVTMGPVVFVSLHRPERAGPAVELFRKYGLLAGVSNDPSVAAINWAGQVKWHVSVPERRPCQWLTNGWVMATADGRVTRCSLDASGVGVICNLTDDLYQFQTDPYNLCPSCDQLVPPGM